jgi:predicted nucleotidyltransferase
MSKNFARPSSRINPEPTLPERSTMQAVTPEIMNGIVRRLVAEFDPEQIILFGSRAWGTPHEDSDVDLLVIVGDTEERELAMAVRAHRCMRGIPEPMDLLVKTRKDVDWFAGVPASLEAEILERGKVLYGRSESRAYSKLAGALVSPPGD